MIGLVCCCDRDAAMLPLFCEQWHRTHQGVPLVLGNCVHDPVHSEMQQYQIDWRHTPGISIMRAMLAASIDHQADVVLKLDVDCYHRTSILPEVFSSPAIDAAGVQWADVPHHFLGIAYGIRRRLLVEMESTIACDRWFGGEDAAMSWFARALRPNSIHLLPTRTVRRAQTDDGHCAMVHCGHYYQEENPRHRAYQSLLGYVHAHRG